MKHKLCLLALVAPIHVLHTHPSAIAQVRQLARNERRSLTLLVAKRTRRRVCVSTPHVVYRAHHLLETSREVEIHLLEEILPPEQRRYPHPPLQAQRVRNRILVRFLRPHQQPVVRGVEHLKLQNNRLFSNIKSSFFRGDSIFLFRKFQKQMVFLLQFAVRPSPLLFSVRSFHALPMRHSFSQTPAFSCCKKCQFSASSKQKTIRTDAAIPHHDASSRALHRD